MKRNKTDMKENKSTKVKNTKTGDGFKSCTTNAQTNPNTTGRTSMNNSDY